MAADDIDIIGKITVDDSDAKGKLEEFSNGADDVGKGFVNMGDVASIALGQIAANIATGVVEALADAGQAIYQFVQDSIAGAAEDEDRFAQLDNVLRNLGETAPFTRDELDGMAESIGKTSTFSADAATQAETMLLRFKSIGEETFPMVMEAGMDLSAGLGRDLNSTMMMLGRALENPEAGMGMLRRMMIVLSDEQKEQIKTMSEAGDTMGAQQVILDAISSSYGGSAAAAASTYNGQMAILKNTFGEMKDTLGEAFLPILTDVVGVFMDLANNTQVNDFLTSFSDRIKGVLGAVQSMAEGKSGVATILQSLGIDPVKVHEIMALIQPLMDAFGELGSAFRASLPAIQEMFGRVKDAAQASFGAALPAIFANLTVAVSTITEFWKAHGEEIIAALEFTFRTIVAVVSGALVLVTGIIRVGLQLLSGVFDFFGKLMKGDWEGAWLSIQNTAAAVWATIVTTFNGFMNAVLGAFGTNFEAFKAQWSENWEMLKTITGLLWDKIVQGIKDKVAEWKAIGKSIVDGLKQGLIDNWNGVIKWLKDAAQRLIDSVMNMFDMKSPSGVFEDIGENLTKGLAIGITGGIAAPVKSMEGMASSLTSAAAGAGSGGGFGGSIVINVSGAGDPREVARQVARELTSQLKMQGLNSFTNALGGG